MVVVPSMKLTVPVGDGAVGGGHGRGEHGGCAQYNQPAGARLVEGRGLGDRPDRFIDRNRGASASQRNNWQVVVFEALRQR